VARTRDWNKSGIREWNKGTRIIELEWNKGTRIIELNRVPFGYPFKSFEPEMTQMSRRRPTLSAAFAPWVLFWVVATLLLILFSAWSYLELDLVIIASSERTFLLASKNGEIIVTYAPSGPFTHLNSPGCSWKVGSYPSAGIQIGPVYPNIYTQLGLINCLTYIPDFDNVTPTSWGETRGPGRSIVIPFWVFELIGLYALTRNFIRARKRCIVELRRREGLCLSCGYDLRGIKDRCPECGTLRELAVGERIRERESLN
jgi:hypothetical protein